MTKLRADAARNRRLLIDAASAEFAAHGLEVSVAQIAHRAGIGKGTVFRHFPTKERLMAAIFSDQLEQLADTGTALLEAPDPWRALREFMTAGAELQADDRSFCQAVASASRADPEVRAAMARLIGAAEALAARARAAGAIREDVSGQDVVLLLGGAVQAAAPLAGVSPGLWRRYLHLAFDALTPAAAHPLPVPSPTAADFTAAAEATGAPSGGGAPRPA
ncbi:TetR/AcrR family transcriptional regulator [Streptomyces hoynatensis]|uniref:TetR/AcrR family transcriptional regulator n=1 Tax=Streptomyces hoynatensis TaxID=1141874 RepID=A0A3A9ZCK2_9ACTN|nr:TetR/AcrR family transcriptional regulator [Streptomyces hoynatensis]RKN45963.1 TetR/AcrR family transcriptional regulator [Streptomyces hoynatensis]